MESDKGVVNTYIATDSSGRELMWIQDSVQIGVFYQLSPDICYLGPAQDTGANVVFDKTKVITGRPATYLSGIKSGFEKQI